ncbi:MAG: tryptophan 2,3-dioxygenase family protein [Salibacteraceae bacterium]
MYLRFKITSLEDALNNQLKKLHEKYDLMGQDLSAYLDGLLLSNYLTYWDYVQLDTLLTLQNPKTDFPDESIFIMYHQITELYFKLTLHELDQVSRNGKVIEANGQVKGWNEKLNLTFFIQRLKRINGYFEALTTSFDIMINGMEKEQFTRFRMALLPASGFQSAQYRMIEICSTDLRNLVALDDRITLQEEENIDTLFEHIYWKNGATELETGKKTLTLKQFEKKYSAKLKTLAAEYQERNLWAKYQSLSKADQANEELIKEMRQFDINVNVNWPLSHYKSAVRYLASKDGNAPATGGTNWQKYLPPRFQKRIFFPALWSSEEFDNWGRGWVESVLATSIVVEK